MKMSSSINNKPAEGESAPVTKDMKKFMFDTNDFDRSKVPDNDRPVYSENQMAAAKAQSHAQGKKEGLGEAGASQEEQIIALLGKISGMAEQMIAAEERREIERMMDATRVAMRVMHKMLPAFAREHALHEIETVILQSLEVRKDEPRIAIMVSGEHLEQLKSRLDALALEKGYAGKLILIADDHLGPGDCRVEWADGGAERLYDRLIMQIESEFTKAMAAMQATLNETK